MKCYGIGRFVKDPVLKDVNETCVCEFALAMDEHRKVKDERKKFTSFFDFVIWDKAAELIAQWRKKGDLIFVEATARQDKWSDKETGAPRSKVIFRVDNFRFLPRNSQTQDEENE